MSAENFELASSEIENHFKNSGKASDDNKLILYAFFKQGKFGDCNTERPGFLDFKGKSKWDAWNAKKGVSKEEAQVGYVKLAKTILPKKIADTL